jgi:hypothetical protein
VPKDWADSEERQIKNAADVAMRSFSTKVHQVATFVSYRQEAGEEGERGSESEESGDGAVKEEAEGGGAAMDEA